MKLPALILYLLLSLFGGDRVQNTRSAEQLQASATGSRILEEEKDCNTYTCPKSDLCLTPGQGGTFTGQNPSSQLKSNFRLVRYGKLTNRSNLKTFLTDADVTLSGLHTSARYLYSICRLRL